LGICINEPPFTRLGVSRYPVGTPATTPAARGTWRLTDAGADADADGDTLEQATAL
jgi:hypothetical protein